MRKLRIGIGIGKNACKPAGVKDLANQASDADRDGFDILWHNHTLSVDSLIAIAISGATTRRIEFLTGVIPIYSRQPVLMAQQALTAHIATRGRLSLGLGVAHPETVPLIWGQAYDKPAKFMREYLGALLPLLNDYKVDFAGDMVTTQAALEFEKVTPPRVLIAALGPLMLRLAGAMTDGTVLFLTGPKTIRSHILPLLKSASEQAETHNTPRIIAVLPICITNKPDLARESAARTFEPYGKLVNYRRMLEIEGTLVVWP